MESFEYIYDYYPESISEVTDEQKQIRERVQAFMSGDADPELIKVIVHRVKDAVATNQIDVVCFAPAPSGAETILRFGELAEVLSRDVNCDVFLDAVTLQFNADPITLVRYYKCNEERVKRKRVLVVGDVSTTGQSLRRIDELLNKKGAKEVYALFLAKTKLAQ